MLSRARLLLSFSAALSVALAASAANSPADAAFVLPVEETALVVEPAVHESTAGPLELSKVVSFRVKNVSSAAIVVTRLRTTCGCTVPQGVPEPWTLGPGESGEFRIAVDLRGKRGLLDKQAFLDTARGYKPVGIRITIPEPDPRDEMRLRNLLVAQGDRQAVFKNDCAQCHATPTQGKFGRELYIAACAICHADEHRASMVPDLRALAPQPTADVWRQVISTGKSGTLMPAFALENDGPLTRPQIDSLVEYLTSAFARESTPLKPGY